MLSAYTGTACSLFSEMSIPICHNCQIPRSDQLIPGVHCQLICVMDDNFTNAPASFCVFQTAISTELHCSLINKAALFFFFLCFQILPLQWYNSVFFSLIAG